MTKKAALQVLLKHSFLLDKQMKETISQKIDGLSASDVVAIGTFLAMEKKQSLRDGAKMITAIDLIIKQLAK